MEEADCVRAGKVCTASRKPRALATSVTPNTRKCSSEAKSYKGTLTVERVWFGGLQQYYVCG
ncbi:hypothetical protein BJ508DRAFT_418971 [Ascobolus immersus RN42]|uniref:Uncharacterized protein n=1 Tax=Ascobolus immersus RN42 TaxID=1160509 RepID=A0A3N4HHV0_ASCIM|nr:hypothetical protein BJ508DRAFT_418971 [Ascobolus immersus RN42]